MPLIVKLAELLPIIFFSELSVIPLLIVRDELAEKIILLYVPDVSKYILPETFKSLAVLSIYKYVPTPPATAFAQPAAP